jgi:hypothetical protein
MRLSLSWTCATLLALSATAWAQRPVLTLTGSYNPGQTITVDVRNAPPLAAAFLAFGRPGATTLDYGSLGSLTVELSAPFELHPIGATNASGRLTITAAVPANQQVIDSSVTLQIVTVSSRVPPLAFNTTNVAELVSGDGGALAAVRRWNQHAIDASGVDHAASPSQPGPGRASRAMAIVHIAMFESLLAIDGGFDSYLGVLSAPPVASRVAAIARAAHDSLVALYPRQAADLDAKLAADLSRIAGGTAKTNGMVLGAAAAGASVALRAKDGSNHAEPLVDIDFICSLQPGFWRQDPISRHPLALGAHWYRVIPFVLSSAAQFRTPSPPAMTSAEYTAAYNEVKTLGGDGLRTPTTRTAEQTFIGVYWGYDGMPSLCAPPRLYNQIATLIASQRNLDALSLARLLALVNVALADAGIASWESKYFYQLWRPIGGIRESDPGTGPTRLGDGNSATVGDTAWSPLGAPASNTLGSNFTPPFPAYPSGHATFGGALFQVMRRFFGTDDIPFTFVSDEFNGVTLDNRGTPRALRPRSFPDFSAAEEENGQSRIYLGIHWSFDKTEGIAQGRRVADWVFDHLYQPTR